MYWLFEAGKLVDEYNSCPGYFTDGARTPAGGNAVQLCAAFDVSGKAGEVEKTLHHTDYVFALDRHTALAKALGLPWEYAGKSFGRLSTALQNERLAKIEGIDPQQFLRIEREQLSTSAEAR